MSQSDLYRQFFAESANLRNQIKNLQTRLEEVSKSLSPEKWEINRCQKHGIMGCMPCRYGEPTQAPTWEELNNKNKEQRKHFLTVLLKIKGGLDWYGKHPYEAFTSLGDYAGQILRMQQIIEKEFPTNQCDGCMAGIPIDGDGNHRMGKPGEYANLQRCEKSKYINPDAGPPP